MKMSLFMQGGTILLGWLWLLGPGLAFGLSDWPDMQFPPISGQVNAVVQHGDRIYIGGAFTSVGGVTRNRLAALDAATGQVDPQWNPDMNGYVNALAVAGGYIYAAGTFTTVNGGTPRAYVAAFPLADGIETGVADAWQITIEGAANMAVRTLTASNSRLYIGGSFNKVNSTPRINLAAVGLAGTPQSGQLDAAWNPQMILESTSYHSVKSLLLYGNKLYAGVDYGFWIDNPAGYPGVVALELANGSNTGAADPAWLPRFVGFDDGPRDIKINALCAYQDKLFVAGLFQTVNGEPRSGLVAFNLADGIHPATVNPTWGGQVTLGYETGGYSEPYQPKCLAVVGQQLVVGGYFIHVNGWVTRRDLAAFDLSDGGLTAWAPEDGLYSTVLALSPRASGGLLVGGFFTSIGGKFWPYLAGFDTGVPVTISAFSCD